MARAAGTASLSAQIRSEVVLHQREEALSLPAIEPDDGGKVLHLLGREVINLPGHFPVDIPGIDHEHLVLALRGLGPVEVPQLARNGASVEEVRADGDHHVHVTGLDDLLAHLLLAVPGARRLGGHDEPGAALLVQIAPEVGDPEVVAVRDLLGLVHAGQAERQARVALDALGIDQVHVEGRIGHDEVALADQGVLVLVVGDGLGDLSLQAVDGEVHLGDADGVAVLLLAVEDDLLRRVAALVLDEVAGLDEHAARTGWPDRGRCRGRAR